VEIDAVNIENLSTLSAKNASVGEHYADSRTDMAASGVGAPAKRPSNGEDLDAIFASEDEIPF
jgi:hypothetical protein